MPKKYFGTSNKDFQEWKDSLELAREVRKKAGEKSWKRNIALFNNQNWSLGAIKGDDKVVINKLRSTVSFIRDATYFRDPRIEVDPDPDDDAIEQLGSESLPISVLEQSELAETILNKMFPRLRVKREGKKCLLDGMLTPLGWLKIFHETKTISHIPKMEEVTDEKHVVRRISPFDMLVDPEADCFDMGLVRWLAQRKAMTMGDVKHEYEDAEGRDVNLSDLKSDGSAFKSREELANLETAKKNRFERVIIWEIHDRENDRLLEVSEANGILRETKTHPYAVTKRPDLGFIFVPVTLSDENPEGFYPRPYVETLIPVNNAINRMGSYFHSHVGRAAKRNLISPKNTFDDINRLVNSADMEVLEYNIQPDAKDPVSLVPVANIPEDAWGLNNYLFGPVWRELSRVDELSSGAGAPPGTSPTEAQILQRGTGVGLDAKTDTVSDFLADVARVLLANIQQFNTKAEAIQIAGSEGSKWASWTKKDITGRFHVNVQAFSTVPMDDNFQNRKYTDALNLLYGKPEVDNVELVSAYVDRVRLPSRTVRRSTQQGPQHPDTEHVMLIKNLPLRVDPAEDHRAHLQSHQEFLEFLEAQLSVNPGQTEVASQIRQLSSHMDQHRQVLVQITQPIQSGNAAVGSAAQPTQDISQDRSLITGENAGPQSPDQALAELVGGGF